VKGDLNFWFSHVTFPCTVIASILERWMILRPRHAAMSGAGGTSPSTGAWHKSSAGLVCPTFCPGVSFPMGLRSFWFQSSPLPKQQSV
jgi:hypothetical protein